MKERPILFSGAMVRAILEGRKTQTRRVINPQPLPYICGRDGKAFMTHNPTRYEDGHTAWTVASRDVENGNNVYTPCKFGMPGERLWVRETFLVQPDLWERNHGPQPIHYAASTRIAEAEDYVGKPSIHMPRWASRIMLEITAVRAERVQKISGQDCWAEGIEYAGWDCTVYGSVVDCYRDIWESIYGKGSWDGDPWVWVVGFQQVKGGDQ